MSDDQTGAPPPPPPQGPPVFLPQTPATPPPPDADRKTGADAWPWYFGFAALVGGVIAAFFLSALLAVVWTIAGWDLDGSAFIVVGTAVQAITFIATAVFFARLTGPVTPRVFGLLRAPFWPTVGKMAGLMVSYFVILAIYNALVHLSSDDTPDKLGANSGVIGMLVFGILVAVLAPISEEIFFRGMIFRSFANTMGIWGGALLSGILFGALHIDSFSSDRLLQVVPLALLGVMFALLYAWSGTLYSTIALHATNNSLAVLVYAADKNSDFGMVLAPILWVLMMIACTIGWRFTDNGEPESAEPPPPPPPLAPQPVFTPQPAAPQAQPPTQPVAPPPDRPDFPWGQP